MWPGNIGQEFGFTHVSCSFDFGCKFFLLGNSRWTSRSGTTVHGCPLFQQETVEKLRGYHDAKNNLMLKKSTRIKRQGSR